MNDNFAVTSSLLLQGLFDEAENSEVDQEVHIANWVTAQVKMFTKNFVDIESEICLTFVEQTPYRYLVYFNKEGISRPFQLFMVCHAV
jgi:hypothetical protein